MFLYSNLNQHIISLPDSNPTQGNLDYVSNWTDLNIMKLNEKKCNFMIFSRSESKFTTRLHVNNIPIDQKPVNKILGVWLSDDLSWTKNTKEICIKAYSRMGMITKLKYVGVKTEDLQEFTHFISGVLCNTALWNFTLV